MTARSPARTYALVFGLVLFAAGAAGFAWSSSFGSPGDTSSVIGLLRTNGWHNVVHLVTGGLGLLMFATAARAYALLLGVAYLGVAIWGFAVGSHGDILGFLPINTFDNFLHLGIALLGLVAFLASHDFRPVEAKLR